MRKIELGEITIFASRQTYEEYHVEAETTGYTLNGVIEEAIGSFFTERIHDEVVSFYMKWKAKQSGVAILDAHGYRENKIWYFHDGKKKCRVQNWVDSVDGKYGTLVLLVCDESISTDLPKTKASILFLPDGKVVKGLFAETRHHFSLIHPTYGEIDGYSAAHAQSQLLAA